MKNYDFHWNENYYLIHVQFDSVDSKVKGSRDLIIRRVFEDETVKEEHRIMTNEGFRFIISRSCPDERSIIIEYDDNIIMKVFLIDDRAYYPTNVFFEG